jgi:hypothetical protein
MPLGLLFDRLRAQLSRVELESAALPSQFGGVERPTRKG